MVKKGDEEVEVPDGLKGRIIPFQLVQASLFQADLQAISDMEARIEEIVSETEEIKDGFSDDEAQEYLEGDDNPKLDSKRIKKDAKSKDGEIEPETLEKLKRLVSLWDEKSKLNKSLKTSRQALIDKTREAVESLSDEEIASFLHTKWIAPVCEGINNTLTAEIDKMEKGITALAAKYAVSYHELNDQLVSAQNKLAGLITQLEGDKSSIDGLNALMNSFKD